MYSVVSPVAVKNVQIKIKNVKKRKICDKNKKTFVNVIKKTLPLLSVVQLHA